jgi:hypothetical protein
VVAAAAVVDTAVVVAVADVAMAAAAAVAVATAVAVEMAAVAGLIETTKPTHNIDYKNTEKRWMPPPLFFIWMPDLWRFLTQLPLQRAAMNTKPSCRLRNIVVAIGKHPMDMLPLGLSQRRYRDLLVRLWDFHFRAASLKRR